MGRPEASPFFIFQELNLRACAEYAQECIPTNRTISTAELRQLIKVMQTIAKNCYFIYFCILKVSVSKTENNDHKN